MNLDPVTLSELIDRQPVAPVPDIAPTPPVPAPDHDLDGTRYESIVGEPFFCAAGSGVLINLS